MLVGADPEKWQGADWLAQPKLDVTKNTTVTLDARKAKPVKVTVPGKGAKPQFASADYTVETNDGAVSFGWWLDSFDGFRTAHLGPQITNGTLSQQWDAHFSNGAKAQYSAVSGGTVKKLATGYTRAFKAKEFATVQVGMGAAASGKKGAVTAYGWLPGGSGASGFSQEQKLPSTRTLYLSTANGVTWDLDFEQLGGVDEDGWPVYDAGYSIGAGRTYKGGKTYKETVNTAVFGPRLTSDHGVFRDGNSIYGLIPLFADGKGHVGSSEYSSAVTTLYRNGKKAYSIKDPLFGEESFAVPSGDAAYRLTTTVRRSAKVAATSTRIDGSWTFRSKKTSGEKHLPVSSARFAAVTGLDSKVAAGKKATFPVVVEGAAQGKNLKSLAVYVSYNGGKTWKKTTVTKGKVTVKNPAKGKAVSLRAKIVDKKGNASLITVYNAYYGK